MADGAPVTDFDRLEREREEREATPDPRQRSILDDELVNNPHPYAFEGLHVGRGRCGQWQVRNTWGPILELGTEEEATASLEQVVQWRKEHPAPRVESAS